MRVSPEKRFDWDTVTDAFARSSPVWQPGTRSEYHGGSFGYLVGQVVRRLGGRSLSAYFREEIAQPFGADYLIDFGPEHDHRCAEMTGPQDMVGGSNSRQWRAAGDGSATAVGTADGLARVYAALARGGYLDGQRLLRAETIQAAIEEQPLANGEGTAGDFGLGYLLLWKIYPGLGTETFGHTGMGGSIGLADPRQRLGFGYVMNHLGNNGAAHLLGAITDRSPPPSQQGPGHRDGCRTPPTDQRFSRLSARSRTSPNARPERRTTRPRGAEGCHAPGGR